MTGVKEVFNEGGLFHRSIPGFNPRASQLAMAMAVNDTLHNGGRLVVESGTGTGKSLAYLVPAILRVTQTEGGQEPASRRIVVSTHTISLQQLGWA